MKLKLFFIILAMTLTTPTHANPAKPFLARCPNSPNCVSSQADSQDQVHYIAPFKITGDPLKAWSALQTALSNQARTVITDTTETSLHAKATSLIFRFVDDVHIILEPEARLIHIRSASRTGYSDFGVNRKRMVQLRQELQQAGLIE